MEVNFVTMENNLPGSSEHARHQTVRHTLCVLPPVGAILGLTSVFIPVYPVHKQDGEEHDVEIWKEVGCATTKAVSQGLRKKTDR